MTSQADIKAAKGRYDDHNGRHKCKAGQCETRKELWLAYMATADNWRDEEQCLTPGESPPDPRFV